MVRGHAIYRLACCNACEELLNRPKDGLCYRNGGFQPSAVKL
jgi:hypothetical protein